MAGNPQEMTVPPVEGVAGGGTAYGWSDGVMLSSNRLQGSIDPTEVPSADLLHVWCMPSTANIGPQEMPRPLEHVSILCFFCFIPFALQFIFFYSPFYFSSFPGSYIQFSEFKPKLSRHFL